MLPIDLFIKDKCSGEIHKIGKDVHDSLYVDDDGFVHYYNMQNGDGCRCGDKDGGYEFVPHMYEDYDEYDGKFYPKDSQNSDD